MRVTGTSVAFLAAALGAAVPSMATAQKSTLAQGGAPSPWAWLEEAKVAAGDGESGDSLGSAVSVDGDTALAGAPQDNLGSSFYAGSAYVFVHNGSAWIEQQKLTASDAEPADSFGISVSLSGDTALVGAHKEGHGGIKDAGAAYVFVRDGTAWSEQQKLVASSSELGDFFGYSVAISGDTAVVGAYNKDHQGGDDEGAVYVFTRSGATWLEQQVLISSDPGPGENFGRSVALWEGTAVIGSKDTNAGGAGTGVAHVFVDGGGLWSHQQKLTASDGTPIDAFGWSVAISGETAVVGAPHKDLPGISQAGSAYVFVRTGTTWSEQQRLVPGNVAVDDWFGESVSVSGDLILVGARYHDPAAIKNAGSAYVFARQGAIWTEESQLTASDAKKGDYFGTAVGISVDIGLVGAPWVDLPGATTVGAAYVFRRISAPSSYCTAGTSASGCQALLSASGTASATAASGFALHAATVEGHKDGAFFWGTNGKQANPWGSGTSYQCVVPPVTRGAMLAGSGTVGACDGSFAQDLNALWCPTCAYPQKNPGAGAVVQAQLWYRDPQSTSNQPTSLSDAIEFGLGP